MYIDHGNNLFNAAMLDNRRICKKLPNWALELQEFDSVKVWIRGEANVLADAPSRAPREHPLSCELPIPRGPVFELIEKMYRPDHWDEEAAEMVREPGLGVGQAPEPIFRSRWPQDRHNLTWARQGRSQG